MSVDKKPILLDIEASPNDLTFQEFTPSNENLSYNSAATTAYEPDRNIASDATEESPKHSIWSIEYFQKFFDVNTDAVVERIKGSMMPKPGINYLQHYIQSKPDLYGPFWICVTLIFTIAVSGNMANYLQVAASHKYHWKYEFHIVSSAATVIFLYVWFFPLILWGALKFDGNEHFQLRLLELICIYGYSVSVYVPISILWVIQISWLQWLLVIAGALLSGSVLVTAVAPAFGKKSYMYIFIISCLHLLLAAVCLKYFFHVPPITAK